MKGIRKLLRLILQKITGLFKPKKDKKVEEDIESFYADEISSLDEVAATIVRDEPMQEERKEQKQERRQFNGLVSGKTAVKLGMPRRTNKSEEMKELLDNISAYAMDYYSTANINNVTEIMEWMRCENRDFPIHKFKSLNTIVGVPQILVDYDMTPDFVEEFLNEGLGIIATEDRVTIGYEFETAIADRCEVLESVIQFSESEDKYWEILQRVQFLRQAVKYYKSYEIKEICKDYYGNIDNAIDWNRVTLR